MKAVLLACVVVAAVASPGAIFEFVGGFQKALESTESCADAPWTCGRTLGNLLTLATSKAETTSPSQLRQSSPSVNAQNFLTGLITGLRLDNSTTTACYSVFNQLSYNLALLYGNIADIKELNIFHLIDTGCLANNFLNYDFTPCNFYGLWEDIINIKFGELFDRYSDSNNMCALNDGWMATYHCDEDFEQCGFGVGLTIRLLVGWGV